MLSMHKSLGEFNLIFAFAPESFALRFFFSIKNCNMYPNKSFEMENFHSSQRLCQGAPCRVFCISFFFSARDAGKLSCNNWRKLSKRQPWHRKMDFSCSSESFVGLGRSHDGKRCVQRAIRCRWSEPWINIGAWECQDECEENFSLKSINFDSLKGCSENTTAIQFAESSLATIMSLLRMLATSKHILITTRGTVAKTHF